MADLEKLDRLLSQQDEINYVNQIRSRPDNPAELRSARASQEQIRNQYRRALAAAKSDDLKTAAQIEILRYTNRILNIEERLAKCPAEPIAEKAQPTATAAPPKVLGSCRSSRVPIHLARLRVQAGWTQEEFAHKSGVDKRVIGRHERGARADLSTLTTYADTLATKAKGLESVKISDLTG
jgi:DNA-binding XRE family transcriptional regulator